MYDSEWDGPLSPSDLRAAAGALDEIEATDLAANANLGRIEAVVDDALVGHYVRFDVDSPEMGWGFVALGNEA